MKSKVLLIVALALVIASTGSPAAEFSVEAFGGYYSPDGVDDHGEIFGASFGGRATERFGWQVSTGWIDVEDDFAEIDNSNLRFNLFLVDFEFQFHPTGNHFYLFAGPGWATVELEANVPGVHNNLSASDDIFTINGGLGYRWDLGESFYVRPEVKARYFDGADFEADQIDSYEGLDTELSIAVGYRFGSL